MYIVTISNNGIETPIHNEREKLHSGKVVKGINTIDSFTFSILPSNAGFDLINEFTTLVTVYNTNKKRYDFIGRVLYPETRMDEGGLITKEVTCESIFGYLCDSQQTYVDTKNWTVLGLLQHLIDCHNSQTEEYKHFTIGEVTATDANDNLYLGIQRANTWDAINEKLIKKIGGELRYRVEDGVIYIDYLEQLGETRSTAIELSVNMKSITREKDPTAYITRLIPLGAKLSDDTEERLEITSVNDGKNYIDDETAIAVYGIHVGYVEFDDVTTPGNLLNKGMAWMIENNKVQIKYSVTALDLSLIGLAIDDLDVCDYHPIKNALLGIDDTARIIKKTIDICEEVKSTIEMGDNFKTLSDIQQEQAEQAAQNIQNIQAATKNLQTQVSETKNSVSNLETKVEEMSVNVKTDYESYVVEALKNYVETTTHESFKNSVESEFEVMADSMAMNFSETTERINNVEGDTQTKLAEIYKHISFGLDGITIGSSENAIKMNLDNDQLVFSKNGVEIVRLDIDNFIPTNVYIKPGGRLRLGNFAWDVLGTGIPAFLKVGG